MLVRRPTSKILCSNCRLRHFVRSQAFPLSRTDTSRLLARAFSYSEASLTTFSRRHTIFSQTMTDRYKLIYTVPASHLVATKDAIFETGAGVYDQGKYVQVAFELTGQGQFRPVAAAGADPHTGAVDQLERVLEYRVEILCSDRNVARAAVAALKSVHPYETPAYEVYKLENI
ncbi:hypothetical protein CABS01_16074 [Colletotrichum abscissum]|uniref:ATP phosphoribosyltransferase n=1 Tax=Colletotrichum abscissum TaxID=1671311 RepID=A0A9Q0AWM0_9PEZI|nr:uncharacterized protein CABS01_16074 [Colletotrichum abscissum]KAI3529782.1 hypothetical protein CABS02_14720 [Colletotrichum abscissum]KAK1472931.1 hypothetical protein CABS01_16074 [Colletotrichum abscissum]